jgi:hypothetical protein
MEIIGKNLSLKEFKDYVNQKNFGSIPPSWLVIHHTWKPTRDQWQGSRSIAGLKRFYEGKGWSAGPHLFIAEDGIWLFTDMYDVGIHAGVGNAHWKSKRTGRVYGGYLSSSNFKLLGYSIGIEVVGNYDNKIWSEETYKNTVVAIKILMKKLKLKNNDLKFHRDYSSKSCPGWAIKKEWLIKQLADLKLEEPQIKSKPEELKGEENELENKFNDKESLLNMKQVIVLLLKKMNINFGRKLSNSERKGIIQWIKKQK